MKNHSYISMQQDMPDQGQLQVTVLDSASNRPVENAAVRISYTGVPDNVIEEVHTDSSGKNADVGVGSSSAGIQHETGGAAALCRIYSSDQCGGFYTKRNSWDRSSSLFHCQAGSIP